MFLLSRSHLPDQPAELAAALDQGLRVFVSRTAPMVAIQGSEMRALESIAIDLSGGRIESLRKIPRPVVGQAEPAIATGEFSLKANPLSIWNGDIAFELTAHDVEFAQAKQADEKLVLVLHRAQSGNIRIEADRAELERLVAHAAGKLAEKQGVTIESVKLELEQRQPRVLEVKAIVAARKLLFRPVLTLGGVITVTEQLMVTISNLNCSGDSSIAALACAAIAPQFRRIEGQTFPLSIGSLGEVQLRDVAIELVNDRLAVVGKFGQRSARA